MPELTIKSLHLQLAMAFGQGAGAMLASQASLEFLLSSQAEIIARAESTWQLSRPAFTELVRLLGQISATKAAIAGRAEIDVADVESSVETVLGPCPCFGAQGARGR